MSDATLDTLTKVIGQEFRRAGRGQDPRPAALGMSLGHHPQYKLPGSVDHWESVRALQQTGNPDASPGELVGETADETAALMALRQKQMQGFKGRGWSNDEINQYESKNGPLPPMLMSEGSQQADAWQSNRDFVNRLYELEQLKDQHPNWAHQRVEDLKAGAAKEWQGKQGRQYGESGWLGFTQNPEYTLGYLMNNLLDPGSNAYSYGRLNEGGSDRGGFLGALTGDGKTYTDIKAHANKVSPILPGDPKTPQEKEEQFRGLKKLAEDADPRSKTGASAFDMYYRRHHDEYPSYAGSTAWEFGQNMIDPTILLGGVGSKGLSSLAKALLREAAEEIPLAVGLGAGATAYQEHRKSFLPEGQRNHVNFGEMFTPGVRDELPDENKDQFIQRDRQEQADRRAALDKAKEVLPTIPGNEGRPSGTPYGMMMPWTTKGRR